MIQNNKPYQITAPEGRLFLIWLVLRKRILARWASARTGGRPADRLRAVGGGVVHGAVFVLAEFPVQRLLRSISMRRKPMPLAVLAAASMLLNTRPPPVVVPGQWSRSVYRTSPGANGSQPPSGSGRSGPWQTRPGRTSTSLAALPYQYPVMKHQKVKMMLARTRSRWRPADSSQGVVVSAGRGRLRKRNLKYVKAAPRQEPSGKA